MPSALRGRHEHVYPQFLVVAVLFIVLLFVTKRQLSDAEKLISEQSATLVKQSLELLVRME
ncbi:hypothetical protein [Pectobacterium carotovorum]|uniref:hypothetical protein n=1 Tax=Pectobacterium carotovorum TaxID=554 RepID=UPI001374ACFB|nr:hypothetical protein [Pectobacterium carotovorum]